jgi:PleD family two-component response regulator
VPGIKREVFTSVLPVIMYVASDSADEESASRALEAGADEVLSPGLSARECELRLAMALHRADRDVGVHPTTLLPGTVQIERDIAERLASGEKFAVCYADLDHFKEFNDRYGYNHGDRVILILSRSCARWCGRARRAPSWGTSAATTSCSSPRWRTSASAARRCSRCSAS